MTETLNADPRADHPARTWWRQVCAPDLGDAAARARLRRCRSTNDVLSIPAGVRLARMLRALPGDDARVDDRFARALDLARVLAHVTRDSNLPPMREVGWPTFPGSRREGQVERGPKLSESRFRRLLQSEPGEDLVAQFTRLVALMGGTANIADLSDAFRWWDHANDRAKQRWAFDYFNAGAAARPTNDSPEDSEE